MKTGAIVAIVLAVVVVAGVGIFIATSGNNNPDPPAETTYEVSFTGENGSFDKTSITVKSGTTYSASGNVLKFSDNQTVTATANAGYIFGQWSSSSGTIVKKQTITATFITDATYKVSFTGENGTFDKASVDVKNGVSFTTAENVMTFSDGQKVTATANDGYQFGSWSQETGTVSADLAITVTFKPTATTTVSFYFTDNFENDGFVPGGDTYTTDPCAVIPGVWVKGSGADMAGALEDACEYFGIDVTISDGTISTINGITDKNIYVWGWSGDSWSDKNDSGDLLKLSQQRLASQTLAGPWTLLLLHQGAVGKTRVRGER